MRRPLVLLGLDGASWEQLAPWLNTGRLPHLARLRREGVWGVLESCLPPVTCPGWRVLTSGKNPGKLGVFWWAGWDRDAGRLVFPNDRSFPGPEVWDYLGEAGYQVAVVNVPTSYPARKVRGIMVSGFGAPLDRRPEQLFRRLTYPASLAEDLQHRYGWRFVLPRVDLEDKTAVVREVRRIIEQRFAFLRELVACGRFELVVLVVFYINTLQHFYGQDEAVAQVWEYIDGEVGWLMERGWRIVVASDHGMRRVERSFLLNVWLAEEGYLRLRPDLGDWVLRLDDRLAGWLGGWRVCARAARRILPDRVLERLPGLELAEGLRTSRLEDKVDWKGSLALALSQGVVYLNRSLLGREYGAFRRELRNKLEKLRSPEGQRVISCVFLPEDIYHGPYVSWAPDLVALPAPGWELYGGLAREAFVRRAKGWTSGNHPAGMFAAWGEGIAPGKVEGMRLEDVAPTMLELFGLPRPEGLDGEAVLGQKVAA